MRDRILLACGLVAACSSGPGLAPAELAAMTPDVQRFEVHNALTFEAPAGASKVRVWFPLPREEGVQTTTDLRVTAPDGWTETKDAAGNRYVHVEVKEPKGTIAVATDFVLTRREQNVCVDPARTRPLTAKEREQFAPELAPNANIVLDDEVRQLAAQIRGDEDNPVRVARRLYDWTLDNVEYWVKDPKRWQASKVGSSSYCLQNRTGNCTDFHSLWTALARASGLPTRMKYGSLFKPALDGVDKDASYHCWPEFWAPGIGWIPHDVAVADIFAGPIAIDADNEDKVALTTASGYEGPSPKWVDYYFGNLDARRVTWSLGRDLELVPKQDGGPVNAVPKGYVEVDGKEFTGWQRTMTYREVAAQ